MITTPPSTKLSSPPTNDELAEKLENVSKLLLAQGANQFRAEAYHRAAETLHELERPAWQIYAAQGIEGLEELSGVGRTISRALQQLIRGGHWPLLERLAGNDVVEQAFSSVPNIGPKLAKRIHDELGIETLAELQAAAWDGRLRRMRGFGEKRIRAVRESLAARGRHPEIAQAQEKSFDGKDDLTSEVPVEELLDVDDEYRFKAAQGKLPRIAPRDSIQQRRLGYQSCIPIVANATIRRCFQTPSMPTPWERLTTGSSFISKTTIIAVNRAAGRSLPPSLASSRVAASYVAANASAPNSTVNGRHSWTASCLYAHARPIFFLIKSTRLSESLVPTRIILLWRVIFTHSNPHRFSVQPRNGMK